MARRLIDQTQQCTVNLGSVALLHIVVGDLDRIDDDLAGLFSVPLMELSRDRCGREALVPTAVAIRPFGAPTYRDTLRQ